jgi:hypothetical protein
VEAKGEIKIVGSKDEATEMTTNSSNRHPGVMPVEMGEDVGRPSRWNTLRVLDWYAARD